VNVYELQLDGVPSEVQLQGLRWELFVCPEIRDVVQLASGRVAVLYEGEQPNVCDWRRVLGEAGYLRALAA
jgi:hypothetical protein